MDHEIGEEKRHLENQGIPFRNLMMEKEIFERRSPKLELRKDKI